MYETLSQIDVSSKIETIGNNRSYLSWSFALDALLQACPDADIRWAKWPLVIFTNSGPEVLEDVRVPIASPLKVTSSSAASPCPGMKIPPSPAAARCS